MPTDNDRKRLRALASAVDSAIKYASRYEPPGDWACVECQPHSDMLIDGFQCAIHALRSEGERTAKEGGVEP